MRRVYWLSTRSITCLCRRIVQQRMAAAFVRSHCRLLALAELSSIFMSLTLPPVLPSTGAVSLWHNVSA